jgi:hypothetical protein
MSKFKPIVMSAFSYEKFTRTQSTPPGYVCGTCGISGIRLYRDYNIGMYAQELSCTLCTALMGKREYDPRRPHSFGWKVAAVPTEEGDTFWGYTSVPREGVIWWDCLPAFDKSQRIPKNVSFKRGTRIPRKLKKELKKMIAYYEYKKYDLDEMPRLRDIELAYGHHSTTEVTYCQERRPDGWSSWNYVKNITEEVTKMRRKDRELRALDGMSVLDMIDGAPRLRVEVPGSFDVVVRDSENNEYDTTCYVLGRFRIQLAGEEPINISKADMYSLIYQKELGIKLGGRKLWRRRASKYGYDRDLDLQMFKEGL